MSSTGEASEPKLKYLRIEGLPGKFNNVLYAEPSLTGAPVEEEPSSEKNRVVDDDTMPQLVCFFGGDIQNYRSEMSPDYERFAEAYSLEAIVTRLSGRFTGKPVFAFQPDSVYQQSFSRFDSFLRSVDQLGTPNYSNRPEAYLHLDRLISRLVKEQLISRKANDSSGNCKEENERKIRVCLIGFSKGGTVLNQLLYSLNSLATTPSSSTEPISIQISHLYFLDTGHNGLNGIWINEASLLQSLAREASPGAPIHLYVGVTAFQLEYKHQKWIANEEATFCNLVRKYAIDSTGATRLKLSRLYLGESELPERKPGVTGKGEDYLRLHFSILDQMIAGRL